MATQGVDCQVILDNVGYMLAPSGHLMRRPRLRKATVAKGGAERYVDAGPGKREWHLEILALTQLTDYGGQLLAQQGKAIREALRASYEKVSGRDGLHGRGRDVVYGAFRQLRGARGRPAHAGDGGELPLRHRAH